MTIEQECKTRNIDRLIHFTRVENIPGILTNGLLPPSRVREMQLQCTKNDPYRHDGLDAICLTVEWPNYKMFWPLRCDNPGVAWAVLQIDHSVLWMKKCCFSITNAADSSVSSVSVQSRSGLTAFQAMFKDYGTKTRTSLGTFDHFPTNPQAEVSCFERIEPFYIKAIWINDSDAEKSLQGRHPNIYNNNNYHWPRADHKHW